MAAPAELAASLPLEEIPVKLRCGACTQLALDAYRTPCCDQSICETCQKSLGPFCPICLHEPVSADDCRPNKALRTTVKVFIKKRGHDKQEAVKKEMASKASHALAAPAGTKNDVKSVEQPSQPSMTPTVDVPADTDVNLTSGPQENSERSPASQLQLGTERKTNGDFSSLEAQKDIARPSVESGNQDTLKQENEDQSGSTNGIIERGDRDEQSMGKSQVPESQTNQEQMSATSEQQWAAMNGAVQGMNNGSFGFDGINGGLPNMGFGNVADFNQMLQFMPNTMQNNMMGMLPNMMSMPGMGMDPMAMAQGMYGGLNGQGIGMNGMNAGMGFANGQLAFGGFNGQPSSWNGVHNNYNQNAYGGPANGQVGDYGSNAGYGGYNIPQGNFNQMNQRQFPNNDFQHGYHGQGFPNRGRGRGRGYQNYGRGRGGYNQVNSGHQANFEASPSQVPPHVAASQNPSQQQGSSNPEQLPDGITRRGSPVYDTEARKSAEDFAKSLDPGDAEDHIKSPKQEQTKKDNGATDEAVEAPPNVEEKSATDSLTKDEAPENPSASKAVIASAQTDIESTKHDSATTASVKMPPPPSPVVPTGPAALSSADHSQFYDHNSRGRGRGFYGGAVGSRGGARGRGAGYVPNGGSVHVPNGHAPLASPVTPIVAAEPKGLGVEGAPKGPKAMREGLPNTAVSGGAKGFSIVGRASAAAQARTSGHTRSRSPSPSRSRSRSPHRSHRHRHHRHRSTDSSYSSDRDRDRKRERRHRHSRRYDDDDLVDDQEAKAADSSSKRSSHRHRDDDKDRESGRSSHRSHRSHRDRSRRRDGDHHSSRRRSRSPVVEAEKPQVINATSHVNGIPPTAPKADRQKAKEEELTSSGRKKREREEDDDYYRERKRSKTDLVESGENADDRRNSKRVYREDEDNSRNKKSQSSEEKAPIKSEPPTPKSEVDAHTLEREARNRERMQKEMQRRSAMDGKGSGPKRKMSGAGVTQGGRRVSYKYEDEESSEARASRVENEREAGRWG